MAYYGRSENEHVDLHLALLVEGVPVAFVERLIPGSPTAIGTRTQVPCVTRVEEGETSLDYVDRRETAATLDIEMLDTDADLFRTLFALGSRPVTWASATATASATTLTLATTTGLVAGQHIYVGDETIIVGTVASGTSLTGCTRGAFGSTASALSGSTSDGDSVYTTPPFWRGRRASLYAYAPDGAGLSVETLLGTYIIDESPIQSGDKNWSMRLAGIIQEYWERSIGVGLREQAAKSVVSISTSILVWVEDASAFRLGTSFPTFASIEATTPAGRDVFAIYEIVSVDTTVDFIGLALSPSFNTPHILTGVAFLDAKIRPIATFSASALLYLLLSREGQGATSYDRLPGRLPASTYDAGWRMGAAFTLSEVDTAAFEAIQLVNSLFVVDTEEKITDVLREWTLLTNTAIVSTVDGKIKPITLAAPRLINSVTIGADDVIPDGAISVTCDEANVYPFVTVRGGYDVRSREFTVEANLLSVELAKKYRRNTNRLEVELKSIGIDGGVPIGTDRPAWTNPVSMPVEELIVYVDSMMKGSTLGRRFLSLSLSHAHLGLRIGDVVTIGTDLPDAYTTLPDFRGSTIVGLSARVVARRPRYDQARVDVRLELIDRRLHVCPAAVITAVGTIGAGPTGGTVVTLSTAAPESFANPTDSFWVGSFVLIIDRSQGGGAGAPFLAYVATIVSSTQIELGAVPETIPDGWTIDANVDYLVLDPEQSAPGSGVSGFSLIEMAKLADDDGTAGTYSATDTRPRWR